MRQFKEIAIVGIGLIGGSLGLAVKKSGLCAKVVGVSRRRKTLLSARRNRAVDIASRDIKTIRNADLVILAAPVDAILDLAHKIAKVINKDRCIVMDVASTKEEVVFKLEKMFPNYLGAHPLAGSEKHGVNYAEPALFKHSLCVLTPTANTKPGTLFRIKRFWLAIGSRVVILSPKTHDRILAFVSHLPHAVAFSLMDSVPKAFLALASGGLKDTTRISASEAHIWRGIFLTNRKNTLDAIDAFSAKLAILRKAISKKDKNLLLKLLEEAGKKRESLK